MGDALERRDGQHPEDLERPEQGDRDHGHLDGGVDPQQRPQADEHDHRDDRAREDQRARDPGERDRGGYEHRADAPGRHRQALLEGEHAGEHRGRGDPLQQRLPSHLEHGPRDPRDGCNGERGDERGLHPEQQEGSGGDERCHDHHRHEPGTADDHERQHRPDDRTGPVRRGQVAGPGAADVERADCECDREDVERSDHEERGDEDDHDLARRARPSQGLRSLLELSQGSFRRQLVVDRERRHQVAQRHHQHRRRAQEDGAGRVHGAGRGDAEDEPRERRGEHEAEAEDPAGDGVQCDELLGRPRDPWRDDGVGGMGDGQCHRGQRAERVDEEGRCSRQEGSRGRAHDERLRHVAREQHAAGAEAIDQRPAEGSRERRREEQAERDEPRRRRTPLNVGIHQHRHPGAELRQPEERQRERLTAQRAVGSEREQR